MYLYFYELLQCERNDDISKEHQCAVADIVQAISCLPVFTLVKEVISESDDGVKSMATSCSTSRAHYLTMLLLFWPYPEVADCRGTRLQTLVEWQLDKCGATGRQLLQNEANQLRQQFRSVLGYVSKCCNCHCNEVTA